MERTYPSVAHLHAIVLTIPNPSVRKQIKIRPGFTPQEDVRRFRGTKQAQLDANALPKGHIIGWAPPPTSSAASQSATKPLSKSAKKNAKRKEKKEEKTVPDDWEDDDEATPSSTANASTKSRPGSDTHTPSQPDWAAAESVTPTATIIKTTAIPESKDSADGLTSKLEKLNVK